MGWRNVARVVFRVPLPDPTEIEVGSNEREFDYSELYSNVTGRLSPDIRQCNLCHALVMKPTAVKQDMHWGFHLRMMQLHDEKNHGKLVR